MNEYHEEGGRRLLAELQATQRSGDVAGIDTEQLLQGALDVWNVLKRAPDPSTATPKEYLNWAADCALEWFDQGREREAGELFRYLLRRHPELSHIHNDPRLLGDAIAAPKLGREAFEANMRGVLES